MRFGVLIAICSVLIAGCSEGTYPTADRNSERAREAEVRYTRLLESNDRIAGADPTCKVRYLGEENGASFVWGWCIAEDPQSHNQTDVSTPFRIEHDSVTWPRDDSYVEDVERMFPEKLANDILNNPNRLKP